MHRKLNEVLAFLFHDKLTIELQLSVSTSNEIGKTYSQTDYYFVPASYNQTLNEEKRFYLFSNKSSNYI